MRSTMPLASFRSSASSAGFDDLELECRTTAIDDEYFHDFSSRCLANFDGRAKASTRRRMQRLSESSAQVPRPVAGQGRSYQNEEFRRARAIGIEHLIGASFPHVLLWARFPDSGIPPQAPGNHGLQSNIGETPQAAANEPTSNFTQLETGTIRAESILQNLELERRKQWTPIPWTACRSASRPSD
jgi:hypothetical protein